MTPPLHGFLQIRLHKRFEIAVEDEVGSLGFVIGAMVLDHLIRM